MFSLHIDTAATWRGGQNQVLLTVMGLRARGHRAMLVAHPDGELRRRAAEGLDFVPLAPGHELDLKAGWKLGRVIQPRPARHRPRPRSARGLDGGRWRCRCRRRRPSPPLVAARRVDFHLKRNSFSKWKYRQVDLFIASSDAIARILLRRRHAGSADRHGARGHRRRAHRQAAGRSTCTRRSGCRTTRRSSATSPRSWRTRASGTSSTPCRSSCATCRTRAFVILGEGELRARSSTRSRRCTSRSTCCCQGSATTCCAAQGVRPLRDELRDRRARARRFSMRWPRQTGDRHGCRRHPGGRRGRRVGADRAAERSGIARARDHDAAARRGPCQREWVRPASPASGSGSASSRWWRERSRRIGTIRSAGHDVDRAEGRRA